MSDRGHAELERSIDGITVGQRHRREPGDLTPLMDSMQRIGLLQPVTITPDGYLICGYRRVEAAKSLGWSTLRVWVRSGISDDLTRLLAERDENTTHKPLTPLEAARLYEEVRTLVAEDAHRRQKLTQFGSKRAEPAGHAGPADSAGPQVGLGDVRRRAAEMVTGTASYARLEQILAIERAAADKSLSPEVRHLAETELESIRQGRPVDPSYQRVKAAQQATTSWQVNDDSDANAAADKLYEQQKAERRRQLKENRIKREAEAARAKRSTKSFTLKWSELDGWTHKYDIGQLARELKPDDWTLFLRVVEETSAFAEALAAARHSADTSVVHTPTPKAS